MAKRGPRPRADERATARIELRVTLNEMRSLRTFAARDGLTIADLLRLAALDLATDSGDDGPLTLGRRLLDRIASGHNSAGVRQKDVESADLRSTRT